MNFKVGDRVRINELGHREAATPLGATGVMTRSYAGDVGYQAFWVTMEGSGREDAYYMKWFDLDVPLSPFEQRVRAYIARELPNG